MSILVKAMSGTPTHDKTQAVRFVTTLDPTAQRFTFQFFSDGDDGYAEVFHGTLDELWPKVLSLNTPERRVGVFVTINETDFAGRRTANIVRARALFVDADGEEQVQCCSDVISVTGAKPTMVVRTSAHRAHFYWCCNGVLRDQFSALQAALIDKLGTDRSVKDLARVMRLPGTLHLKDPNAPTTVKLFVKARPSRWNAGELTALLGLTPTPLVGPANDDTSKFTRADAERLRRLFGVEHFSNELGSGIETNIEEIESAVAAIPPSAIATEADWMKFARGMAHEARVSPGQAEELWQVLDAASAAAPGYDAAENRRRWDRYVGEAHDRPNPITIATIFDMAQKHGWQGWSPPTPLSYSAPIFQTVDPARVPRHRQWAYATKLIKGENTVLAGKGGWGKSAYVISVACSVASGRDLLGEKIWGGPKRVLYMNSEDDVDEIRRRFIAAYHHHGMKSAEIANVLIRGVDSPGHQTLTTGDESAAQLNEPGFAMLDKLIGEAEAEIAVLDPLGPFCPAGLNSNGVMGQVLLKLKRIARKHQCAMAIVHHTRKDGDLTSTDAIGGASAIVNQSRVALLVARMTSEEAKKLPGVLDSELWRYIRIVDAKTNLAPPSSNTHWFRLATYDLSNAEPPTYPTGDGVQVVEKVVLAQLSASPVSNAIDDAAKRAILKAAYDANPPFSPSARGGSDRYIVPSVLDAVRRATGLTWADRDLKKRIEALINEMKGAGWMRVEDIKAHGNKRQGIIVDPARTPWAGDFADAGQIPRCAGPDQIRQMPIKTIDACGTGHIDAPRPTGASNVPMGSGDLMKQGFDASTPRAAEEVSCGATKQIDGASVPSAAGTDANKPLTVVQPSTTVQHAASTLTKGCAPPDARAAAECGKPAAPDLPAKVVGQTKPAEPSDDLDIPQFLRRT